jgi:hypothetical protein
MPQDLTLAVPLSRFDTTLPDYVLKICRQTVTLLLIEQSKTKRNRKAPYLGVAELTMSRLDL